MEATILKGRAASAGVITARARVIKDVIAAYELLPGEVLVCPMTAPEWTPVFDRIAGVITEVGGMLCHAAIVARERGIPAVVGMEGATKRITTGSLVEVDGKAGTVRLIEQVEGPPVVVRPEAEWRKRPEDWNALCENCDTNYASHSDLNCPNLVTKWLEVE